MSDLLVNKTSQASQSAPGSFADMTDMSQASVNVGSSSSIILLIASFTLDQSGSGDHVAECQFAVDDTREGPPLLVFKDNIDKGCGQSIVWALTGISGSHKFALQWQATVGSPSLDTGRVRSFQVIEITDASFLVNITSTATDDATSSYTDLAAMSSNVAPASADSILLLIANHQTNVATLSDDTVAHSFEIDGTREGPEPKAFLDSDDEGCGSSWMWLKTGISSAIDWVVQWIEIQPSISTGDFIRSFQIIEITANANILSAITSVAADTLTGSYTDVVDLVDTVDVEGTDSILLFGACFPGAPSSDDTGVFRFHEGGTGEGPEVYCFQDDSGAGGEGCGHSVYWAATGKAAGSHTFSLRGLNVLGTYSMATDLRRSLTILELTAGVTQVDKDVVDTLDLAIDPETAELTALLERQDAIDLAIENEAGEIAVMIDPSDTLDLAVDEVAELESRADPVDDLDLAVDEQAEIAAGLTAEDDLDLAVDEDSAVMAGLSAEDQADLEIDDQAEVAAGITAEDELDLETAEGVPDVLVRIQPEDTTGLTADELADLLAAAQRLDTLGITVAEVEAVTAALSASDTLDVAIDPETGQVIVSVSATENLDVALVELAELLGILGVSDQLDIVLDDAAELLGLLARSDTLNLVIDDQGQVAVLVTAADTVDLEINESPSQVVAALVAEDTLELVVAEAADLLGLIQRSDQVAIGLVEGAPVLLASVSVQDQLDIELQEAADVLVPVSAADLLDLQISEVGSVVAALTAADVLNLAVDDQAELVVVLQALDQLDLNLAEQADLAVIIEALDNLDLAADDQAALVATLQAADTLGLAIGDVAQVLNAVTAADTLGLTITETSALFFPPLFEGIIVQPFTLTVCREVQFQLEVVREVKFTLQIEGSGIQL